MLNILSTNKNELELAWQENITDNQHTHLFGLILNFTTLIIICSFEYINIELNLDIKNIFEHNYLSVFRVLSYAYVFRLRFTIV